MDLIEAFLIVIILIIIYIMVREKKKEEKPNANTTSPNSQNEASESQKSSFTSKKSTKDMSYEDIAKKALSESHEYFQVCRDPEEVKKIAECICDGQDTFDHIENAYGAPNMDYKSWVTSQAVSDDTIKNHQQYLADKQRFQTGGAFFTGRTMSPDSHDSYDPIPWIGLRRPQYVEQCNPTQVPDVDLSLYKGNRYFCFRT